MPSKVNCAFFTSSASRPFASAPGGCVISTVWPSLMSFTQLAAAAPPASGFARTNTLMFWLAAAPAPAAAAAAPSSSDVNEAALGWSAKIAATSAGTCRERARAAPQSPLRDDLLP